ncbi:hypothetical protein F5X99DRAFT_267653 [Biscogniauxia marginata]|nr:hypothetical protein F5X99DRAFT_267653 [Biscogniauxia marginata]
MSERCCAGDIGRAVIGRLLDGIRRTRRDRTHVAAEASTQLTQLANIKPPPKRWAFERYSAPDRSARSVSTLMKYIGAATEHTGLLAMQRSTCSRRRPLSRYIRRSGDGERAWALVASSSAGIELGTAQELATRGFTVILLGQLATELADKAELIKTDSPGAEIKNHCLGRYHCEDFTVQAGGRRTVTDAQSKLDRKDGDPWRGTLLGLQRGFIISLTTAMARELTATDEQADCRAIVPGDVHI